MTTDLDTRLSAAADSLQRASEPLSPAAPPRSLRPATAVVAGAVAAVALVAGTVAVVSSGGPGEHDTATSTGAAAVVPRLVTDAVPDGLRPAGVVEVPTDDGGVTPRSISVYGDPAADDPFAEADLAILTTAAPLVSDEGGETVEVRGHDGLVTRSALPFATTVLWEEADGLTVGVASRTLDEDQVVSIAEGLAVDADARTVDIGTLPGGLPGPLEPVASAGLDELTYGLATLGLPVGESTAGHVAAYVPDGYRPFGHAFVAEVSGDAADLALLRWTSGAVATTEVRGHRAWSVSQELPGWDDGEGIVPGSQGPLSALVWEEAPGVLVLVQTFGPSEDEVRAMAETLRPATDDEWSRMLRLGESADRAMSVDERIAGGQRDILERLDSVDIEQPRHAINGSEGVYGSAGVWSTWLDSDGTVCGAVADVDGPVVDGYLVDAVETCDPEGGPATVVRDAGGEPVLLIGVMPDDAIGRVPVGGEVVEIQTCTGPEDAPAYYVMVIADGELPSNVTFVAADGTDLATVPVEP